MDVESILKALDDLSPDEIQRLKTQLAERERALSDDESEQWENALNRAIANFREGLSEDEIQQIIEAMNAVLVTADSDFDVFPIAKENWRQG